MIVINYINKHYSAVSVPEINQMIQINANEAARIDGECQDLIWIWIINVKPLVGAQFCREFAGTVGSLVWCEISAETVSRFISLSTLSTQNIKYSLNPSGNDPGYMIWFLTILIFEKLTRPSSVKFGVPSSINARSVKYIPRYGTQGGLQLHKDRNKIKYKSYVLKASIGEKQFKYLALAHFFRVSLKFLNLPSDDTVFWSLSISALVYLKKHNNAFTITTVK